jgi:hypothetical protein
MSIFAACSCFSSLIRLTPQRHNGYVYAVAHVRDVDCRSELQDGKTLVDIDAGFEVAPGDASDIEVANAHPWGSTVLVFSDGAHASTALSIAKNPSWRGMSFSLFEKCIPGFPRDFHGISYSKSHLKTGKKWNSNSLQRDGARVAVKGFDHNGILVRKRA